MKYEAKNNGSVATSQALSTPWDNINQSDSRIKCAALGTGYHLIRNAEWTTIARNAELIGTNWDSSVVGSGGMILGHTDGGPSNTIIASINDSDGYYGTNDGILSPGDDIFTNFGMNAPPAYLGQRRTLFLSNNEVIWDLSGNIWEWNDETCLQGDPWYNTGAGYEQWGSDVNIDGTEKTLAGPVGNYVTYGIGFYNGCLTNGNAFLRGGDWNEGFYAGVFELSLYYQPSNTYDRGFRCTYTP